MSKETLKEVMKNRYLRNTDPDFIEEHGEAAMWQWWIPKVNKMLKKCKKSGGHGGTVVDINLDLKFVTKEDDPTAFAQGWYLVLTLKVEDRSAELNQDEDDWLQHLLYYAIDESPRIINHWLEDTGFTVDEYDGMELILDFKSAA